MISKRTFLTSLMVIVLVSVFKVSPSQAISNATLEFSGGSNPDNVCTDGFADAYTTFIPNTDDGGGNDAIGLTLVDGYGNPLGAQIILTPTGTDMATLFPRFPLGTSNGAINDIGARPVRFRLYDTTITDTTGWSQQQVFDALTNSGAPLATAIGDPAFIEYFCDTLPVPGYTFSPLTVQAVCSPVPGFEIWRVRTNNVYGLTFTYDLPQLNYSLVQFMTGTLNTNGQTYIEREFTTGAAPHGHTVFRLFVNGHLQDTATSTSQAC